jgi:uncharacterized membrane protein
MSDQLWTAAKASLPAILKPFRVLWNQMFSFVFFVLGIVAIPALVNAWHSLKPDGSGISRVLMIGFYVALMCGYGLSSMLKARRLEKS